MTEEKAAEIFIAALDRVGEDRRSFLDSACKGDAALRAKVQRLLAADDPSSLFLAPPGERAGSDDVRAIPAGTMVGRYRIVRLIAAGGMGTVYEAQQENPSRTVALKVMKRGLAARSALRRFEHESQFLARLRHPGIAQVHDVGIYDDGAGGTPFFVMEYIPEAQSLTDHARLRALNTRARLELFCTVCDAVQHGHQKGVIHRDIKPDNILVDAAGAIKVIDFGVARATDADVAVTAQTDVGQLIGTLQYMSPEQVEADPHDLDVRSDVYSLGVVLYELLCGRMPYEVSGSRVFEAARVIREDSPERPSTIDRAVRGDIETIVLKALEKDRERRYQSAAELAADIRRYLADQPILARPPSAMYQFRTFARRNKALVGGAAATFAALLLGLVGMTALYMRAEAQRETAESNEQRALAAEAEAELRAEHLERVVGFQARLLSGIDVPLMGERIRQDLLDRLQRALEMDEGASDWSGSTWPATDADESRFAPLHESTPPVEPLGAPPSQEPPKPSPSESRLDDFGAALGGVNFTDVALASLDVNIFVRALAAIDEEFADQPLVKARLLQTLANTLRSLGLVERALQPQQVALSIFEDELGEEHSQTLVSKYQLAVLYVHASRVDEAEGPMLEVLEARRRMFPLDHSQMVLTLHGMGFVVFHQRRYAEAEDYFREAMELGRRTLGDDHGLTLDARGNLALALSNLERYDEAEPHFRAVFEAHRERLGDDHTGTLWAMTYLGNVLRQMGRFAEAEMLLHEAHERYRRRLGDDHVRTRNTLALLQRALDSQNRPVTDVQHQSAPPYSAHADDHLRSAAAAQPEVFGQALAAVNFTSVALKSLEETIFDRALQSIDEEFDDQPLVNARLLQTLANTLRSLGLFEQALAPQEEALAIRRHELGAEHPHTVTSLLETGGLLADLRRYEEAERCLRDGLDMRRRIFGNEHRATLDALNRVCVLLHAQMKGAEAEECFRAILEVVQQDPATADDDPFVLTLISNIGFAVDGQGRFEEGEHYHRSALEARRRAHGDLDRRTLLSIKNIAISRRVAGRPDQAEPYYREALAGYRRLLGDEHADTIDAVHQLGLVCRELGMLNEALTLAAEAVRGGRRLVSGSSDRRHLAFHLLGYGRALTALSRFEDAEPNLLEGHNLLHARFGAEHEFTGVAAYHLAELYGLWHFAAPGAGHDLRAAEWIARSSSVSRMPPLRPGIDNAQPDRADEAHFRQPGQTAPQDGFRSAASVAREHSVRSQDPPRNDARLEPFEQLLSGVNFTDLALRALDANIFDGALKTLDGEFADQPLVKARLLHTLGTTMLDIGLYERAVPPLEEALAIRRTVAGADDRQTIATLNSLAVVLSHAGRPREGEAYAREALDLSRNRFGEEHPASLQALNSVGHTLHMQSKYEDAVVYFRRGLELRRRVSGDNHPATVTLIGNLGYSLDSMGRDPEAEAYFREAAERARIIGDDARTMWALVRLGTNLRAQGRSDEALPYLREAAEGYQRIHGDENNHTIHALHQVGMVYQALERWEDAAHYGALAAAAARRGLPYRHEMTAFTMLRYGQALAQLARFEEAEHEMLEANTIFRQIFGEQEWRTIQAAEALTKLYKQWHAADPGAEHDRKAAAWRAAVDGDLPDEWRAEHGDLPRSLDSLNRWQPSASHEPHESRKFREPAVEDSLPATDARLIDLERALANVNFTSIALKSLDENIFEQALSALHEEFADQPLVKARLLQTLAITLRELGLTDRALAPQKEALAIRRDELGDEHPETLGSVNQMANLFARSGRFADAEASALEALEAARRIGSDEHRIALLAMNTLGRALTHLDRSEEAEAWYREALAISRRLSGDRDPFTLTLIGNLGHVLSEQGHHIGPEKWNEADAFFREALEGRRRLYGEEHPNTLWVLTNIGVLARTRGDLEAAVAYLRQALDGYRAVRGEEHEHTAHAYHQLGIALREMGQLEEAERLGAQAVRIGRQTFAAGNIGSVFFLAGHGRTLAAMGRFAEAEHRMLEAHEVFVRRAGPGNWRELHVADALAELYESWHAAEPDRGHDSKASWWRAAANGESPRGESPGAAHSRAELAAPREPASTSPAAQARFNRIQQAVANINFTSLALKTLDENIFERAFAAIDEDFTTQPLVRARLLETLASTLAGLGLLERALTPQREALSIRRDILGEEHSDTIASLRGLGMLIFSQRLEDDAEPFAAEALALARRILGNDDPATLRIIRLMGNITHHQERYREAEAYYCEALAGWQRLAGDDDPETLCALGEIAITLGAQDRYDEAEPRFRETIEGMRRVLGNEDRRTMWVVRNYGQMLLKQGKASDAEPLLREAVETVRLILGDDHPQTLRAIHSAGRVAHALGRFEEAERLGAEAVAGARRVLPPGSVLTGRYLFAYGEALLTQERFAEAERAMHEAYPMFQSGFGSSHKRTAEVAASIAELYESWHTIDPAAGHDLRAAEWRMTAADVSGDHAKVMNPEWGMSTVREPDG